MKLSIDYISDLSIDRKPLSRRDLERSTPTTVHDLFAQMMSRMRHRPGAAVVYAVLLWSTYGRIPLTFKQLQHAVAVTLGATEISESNLTTVEKLMALCHDFVSLEQPSGTVRLIHTTLSAYLEDTNIDGLYPYPHQTIAENCQKYIALARAGAQLDNIVESGDLQPQAEIGNI